MKQGSLVLGVGLVAVLGGGLVCWVLAPSRSEAADVTPAEDMPGRAKDGHPTELVAPPAVPVPGEDRSARREQVGPGGGLDWIGAMHPPRDAFALFLELEEGEGPMVELVKDAERFGALFAREVGETIVDGTRPAEELLDSLNDGTTLSFGAGVFRLDLQELLDNKRPFPRDITVAGAGRGATLLFLGDLSVRGPLRNLTIRDCTVFTGNDAALDLRTHGAVLRFDRVHFIGFDSGAGGSCLFNLHANAVYATDCIIEGGYGSSPGSGTLFDVRTNAHLARFESCDLIQLKLAPYWWRSEATIVFADCRLLDLLDHPEQLAFAPAGAIFDGCSIGYFDRDAGSPPAKVLNDLFPGWREALR